jgi:hypothetical protein
MSASLGRVTARLAEPAERVTAGLVDLINRNVNPPAPISAEDVFIRAMYVVSDEVNSFGGCFPCEEHDRLAELLIDSPVMVGHRKDKLPIARNFHAVTVERDGRRWVKSYFYWLKSAEGADNLRENIDGGIYKEFSIGFTFLFPECSICGKDIRSCEHEPLASYEVDGETVVCHFNYRQIERVLETSLVYRGAVNDTSVSKELRIDKSRPLREAACFKEPASLHDLSQLDGECDYLVTPYYDGMMVRIEATETTPALLRLDGEPLPAEISGRFELDRLAGADELYAFLVPYRGKERLGRRHLMRLLEGRSGMVSRLELKLIPKEGVTLTTPEDNGPDCVRVLRHEVVAVDHIDEAARALMTRDGVRLWRLSEGPPRSAGFCYRPNGEQPSSGGYQIIGQAADGEQSCGDNSLLGFSVDSERRRFVLRQFDPARLAQGARFIADVQPNENVVSTSSGSTLSGRLVELSRRDGGYLLRLTGALDGCYALRKIRLEGKQRFLFYRRSDHS